MTSTELLGAIGYDLDQAEDVLESYPAEARDYLRSARRRVRDLARRLEEAEKRAKEFTQATRRSA